MTPVIFISAGSGYAPIRGMLQERIAIKEAGTQVGETHMFFGCMHKDWDFIYDDEIQEAVEAGHLTSFHPAFSHDQVGGGGGGPRAWGLGV
jgi:NADPH-ferrihemoprotein reductase